VKLLAVDKNPPIVDRRTFSHNITVLRRALQAATATVNVTATATVNVTATVIVNVTVTDTVNVTSTGTANFTLPLPHLMLLSLLMLLPVPLSVSQSPYSLVCVKLYIGCIWKQFVASQHFQDQLWNAVILVYWRGVIYRRLNNNYKFYYL